MYTDKLTYTVNEHNNTYHSTINIKPAGVKSSTHIEIDVENKENDLKFEVGDHVRISNYKYSCKRLHSFLAWRSFCD